MKKFLLAGVSVFGLVAGAQAAPATLGGDLGQSAITPSGTGTVSIPLSSLAAQNYTPQMFGAKGDGQTDDSTAIQKLFNSGGFLPPVASCYKVTKTILVPSNVGIYGSGPSSKICLVLPANSPAIPTLDLSGSGLGSTNNISLFNFAVDGGATVGFAPPAVYGGSAAAAAAILAQAGSTQLSHLWVNNAYDNGIGIGQLTANGGQVPGSPNFVSVDNIVCQTNGHNGAGGCVDNLTATRVTVNHMIDNGSSTGFIVDYAGGASTVASDIVMNYNLGACAYIGSPAQQLSNFHCTLSRGVGIWIDSFASGPGGVLSNAEVDNSAKTGFQLNASGWSINSPVVANASTGNTGMYNAFYVYNPGIATSGITNLVISNAQTYGSFHAYGYAESPGTTYTISAQVTGSFNGLSGGVQAGTASAVTVFNGGLSIQAEKFSVGPQGSTAPIALQGASSTFAGAAANAITHVFTSGGNPQSLLTGIYDSGSYNTSYAWLQSSKLNIATSPLVLQPSSGAVGIGYTSPQATFSVNGNATVGGNSALSNFTAQGLSGLPTAGSAAAGIVTVTTGATNPQALSFGIYDTGSNATSYGWIQSAKYNVANSSLILQGGGGNVAAGGELAPSTNFVVKGGLLVENAAGLAGLNEFSVIGASGQPSGTATSGMASFSTAGANPLALVVGAYSTGSNATSYTWLQSSLFNVSQVPLELYASAVGINTAAPNATLGVNGQISLAPVVTASLPSCSSTNAGTIAYVTDATSPTYNGTLTGGGVVPVLALCIGSSGWKTR